MGNTLTVFKRELGTYFNSPVAYIVVTVYLVVIGYMFFSQAFLVGEATMRDMFGLTPLLFTFFAPAITMRLMAEEKRSGTIELLITMPVRDWEVVLGKFFAGLSVLLVAILLTLAYPITLSFMGDLDWGAVMTSSWTQNQVVAYIVAWAITFALFIGGKLLPLMPGSIAGIVEYLSLDLHFNNIAKGVIDTRDLIYYLSLIGACLLVSVQTLDSRRWR